MTEFAASIKLDSRSALEQMRKFSNATNEASKTLKKFQDETKATAQGLGGNLFRKYINSARKADVAMEKSIAKIHDQSKAFSKLTEDEKELILVADKLNRKYDESARNELKLTVIRNDLRKVTAAGLKTQKEAEIIIAREAKRLEESTVSFKENALARKTASREASIAAKRLNKEYAETQAKIKTVNNARKKEISELRNLKAKYDSNYSAMLKIRKVRKELNLLLKSNIIDQKKYNQILSEQTNLLTGVAAKTKKLANAQDTMQKTARLISIYSRIWLGLYAAARLGAFAKDLEVTAEKISLLEEKLAFLTGDSGAYKKLFDMTQDVGIEMDAANKIITRFAVVTNKAFSIETMNEWSSTLIQSARATGTSTQEMSGALIQITQAMSAGRLMGDEYRSVTENLPLLTVALRDLFKDSTLSLKEMSSQGLITNEVMIEAFGKLKDMLEGFPDSTDTTTASIGRLSSAWDNFISKVGNSNAVKNTNNFLSDLFNDFSGAIDRSEINNKSEEILNSFKKVSIVERNINSERKRLLDLIQSATENKDGFFLDLINGQIERSQLKLVKLDIDLEKARKNTKILRGITDEDKNKAAADKALRAEEKLDAARKQELKTEKLIESVLQRKSNIKIREAANIKKLAIDTKVDRFDEGKSGGIRFEEQLKLEDEIDRQTKDSIDKSNKTFIDGQLRLRGLKTNFNLEDLERRKNHNKKILEAEKRFSDEVIRIKSAVESKRQGLEIGQSPDKIKGVSKKEGEVLFEEANIRRLDAVNAVIKNINNEISIMGTNAEKTTAIINKDALGMLKFEKEDIMNSFTKSVIELERKLKGLSDTNKGVNSTYSDSLIKLEELRSAQTQQADRNLNQSLENKFNDQAVASRDFERSIIDLNLAFDRGVISIESYSLKTSTITREYEAQIIQAKALIGEVGQLEQIYAGVSKGVFEFRDNTLTTFEIAAQSTERLFDGMANAIVIGGSKGKEAFSEMAKSILADIQRMIVKSLILKSIGFLGFDFLGSASAPAFTTSAENIGGGFAGGAIASAKGNVFSGPGISSYSNSVVSKPTIFPFAKGTGIMGEAGEEAIMPLTRMPNGNLGVESAGDSSLGGININVNVGGNVESEQDVSGDGKGKALGVVLTAAVQQQLIKEMRPGGILNKGTR